MPKTHPLKAIILRLDTLTGKGHQKRETAKERIWRGYERNQNHRGNNRGSRREVARKRTSPISVTHTSHATLTLPAGEYRLYMSRVADPAD